MKKFFTIKKKYVNLTNIKRFSSEVPPINEPKVEEKIKVRVPLSEKLKNIFYLKSEKLSSNPDLLKKLRVSIFKSNYYRRLITCLENIKKYMLK